MVAIHDNDNDEFGDASFLADFDVDAAVAAARPSTTSTPCPPAKRPKVSPEPPSFPGLETSLQRHFGFPKFRSGQQQAVEAALQGRDVAIFWATGAGKSICYQLPALHLQKVAVVISPLISLMQDQVHKMNGLSERNVATYLGSAQMDPQEEQRAMRGEYLLIYVTPEKLQSQGVLDRLAKLDLCLIAVDESHCVR
jgi:ATP-dependent DNA helicase RecQ